MSGVTLHLSWVKYGAIQWEDWYVQQHGRNLIRPADLQEHVSFANFDLKENGYPVISFDGEQLVMSDISTSDIPRIMQILKYHGFHIDS